MRISGLMTNDTVDGTGICVSYWAQGCPLHCKGCHNEHTWDFDGGLEIDKGKLIKKIIKAIKKDGVIRNFSILGGEPLAPSNLKNTMDILKAVRKEYPQIEICLWTGYYDHELKNRKDWDKIKIALSDCNYIITGRFQLKKRNLALKWRGSDNQTIFNVNVTNKYTHDIELIDVTKEKDEEMRSGN